MITIPKKSALIDDIYTEQLYKSCEETVGKEAGAKDVKHFPL